VPRGSRKNADAKLVALLASGSTVETAAKRAGISPSTVFRRLRSPDFKARIDEARADLVERTLGRLTRLSTKAAETLGELLGQADRDAVRRQAARDVLVLLLRLRDHTDIEERLAAIEEKLAALESQHDG